MFTENTISDIEVSEDAAYVSALLGKLVDIDKTRIATDDRLVLRKAVFGLLEIVAELESRLIALEGPEARAEWSSRLNVNLDMPTPDQLRLGE